MAIKAKIRERVITGKLSSITGLIVSTSIAAAAEYYKASGGDISRPAPYIAAAAVAIIGLYLKK